ncbi:MAG: Rieske 2Fe-2S domain-containing protein [Bacteroidota bacterium]|nr:Rieske 2Fe-2S domain-containing protein [Bacteroidota bacterium]MDP4231469.1 Rieske 2Fe-2S domain-containing protein [Bacteroidota bacterium]MDP4235516.1 Rieske 2Fe-2S domain-containing protein [Bacteroidota bacterium]
MWHPVFKNEELSPGKILCSEIEGKKVLVMRSGNELYSCGAMCPHQGVSMAEGWVFDDEITCPEHSWVFSLKDGSLTWPGSGPRIPIYPVRMNGEMVEIQIGND